MKQAIKYRDTNKEEMWIGPEGGRIEDEQATSLGPGVQKKNKKKIILKVA